MAARGRSKYPTDRGPIHLLGSYRDRSTTSSVDDAIFLVSFPIRCTICGHSVTFLPLRSRCMLHSSRGQNDARGTLGPLSDALKLRGITLTGDDKPWATEA